MNCKPGDLAVIVREGLDPENVLLGRLVEVIRTPGCYPGNLPDGYPMHEDSFGGEPKWIIRAVGKPFSAQVSAGSTILRRVTEYAVAPDRVLRPIRPGDTADSTETMKEKEAV